MDDLISRDYLREIVGRMSTNWEYGAAVSDIYDIIMKAPAVDAVPVVHGRWIYKRHGWAECSDCHHDFLGVYDLDKSDAYCRHCGAKMDGGAES